MSQTLTTHEIEVLRMLNGEREGEWGAMVGACLEFLSGGGYCTRRPHYKITDKGREALRVIEQLTSSGHSRPVSPRGENQA